MSAYDVKLSLKADIHQREVLSSRLSHGSCGSLDHSEGFLSSARFSRLVDTV